MIASKEKRQQQFKICCFHSGNNSMFQICGFSISIHVEKNTMVVKHILEGDEHVMAVPVILT